MPKTIILQRVIPSYRVGLFQQICRRNTECEIWIGSNVDAAKASNSINLNGIRYRQFKTVQYRVLGKQLFWHTGIFKAFLQVRPKVIICEGDSNFLAYVAAIIYKLLKLGRPKLAYWCFFMLPGTVPTVYHRFIRRQILRFFNAFICYHSIGKIYLQCVGITRNVFVATNVCDTFSAGLPPDRDKFSNADLKAIAKTKKPIISYIGSMHEVKKPALLFDYARLRPDVLFLLAGEGPLFKNLQERGIREGLDNIFLLGQLDKASIEQLYSITTCTIIPGRGGIIISESLCRGVPVIVNNADGTEIDLIAQGLNGLILKSSEPEVVIQAIDRIIDLSSPHLKQQCKVSMVCLDTGNMADEVLDCINILKNEARD